MNVRHKILLALALSVAIVSWLAKPTPAPAPLPEPAANIAAPAAGGGDEPSGARDGGDVPEDLRILGALLLAQS